MVQSIQYTAKCRAATFFAGLGLLCLTVFVNYTQNCVSSGMDLAVLMPRYISQRRGSIIFSIAGVLAQPWRFLTGPATFITVLGSFGVFMSPAAAILIVDYWIIRRCKWNIPELYRPGGIYWFGVGANWKAFVAYTLGMFPALPGFIGETSSIHMAPGWRRMFQISFFFGYIVSGGIFLALNLIFPPEGKGIQVDFNLDDVVVVEGIARSDSAEEQGYVGNEKEVSTTESKFSH